MMACARRKCYVEVLAEHQISGLCVPVEIRLEDGENFKIDRVRAVERVAAAKPTSRYTVVIDGKQTYLFREEDGKWFVQLKSNIITKSVGREARI